MGAPDLSHLADEGGALFRQVQGVRALVADGLSPLGKPASFQPIHQSHEIRALDAIAQKRGQSLAQMAIAWVLRDRKVTSALIGASRVEQIEENIKALDNIEFSEEESIAIDKAVQ